MPAAEKKPESRDGAWAPPPPGRHVYEYPRPAVTVDCVVLGLDADDLKVLLVQRGVEPFKHTWALPGGFVKDDEDLDEAARRELREETGVLLPDDVELKVLGTIRLRSGKIVFGFGALFDVDERTCVSETVEIQWPPRSGRTIRAPELDRFRWCRPDEARALLHPAQVPFVDRALQAFRAP